MSKTKSTRTMTKVVLFLYEAVSSLSSFIPGRLPVLKWLRPMHWHEACMGPLPIAIPSQDRSGQQTFCQALVP